MDSDNRYLVYWLISVSATIFLMIIVGGVTRLTQSGLSMVDWRLIMGVIPPISQSDWLAVFENYKNFPEYQKINQGMSIDSFKEIFYWEYSHRLLGRLIGIIFFIPFLWFLMRGHVRHKWRWRLWIALILGSLQGFMGWFMVQSGLVDSPHVSHFRLAAHLLLAIFILGYILWLILDLLEVKRSSVSQGTRCLAVFLMITLAFQLLFGAFTAGLDAGYGFNTYPLMNGKFLADVALSLEPLWRNFAENGAMIQFVHRWLGAILLAEVIGLSVLTFSTTLRIPSLILLGVTTLQFLLGVLTLIYRVPLVLGSLHQAVACLMFLTLVYVLYVVRKEK